MANHPLDNMHTFQSKEAKQLYRKHYDILERQGWFPGSINLMLKDLLLGGALEVEQALIERNQDEVPN